MPSASVSDGVCCTHMPEGAASTYTGVEEVQPAARNLGEREHAVVEGASNT